MRRQIAYNMDCMDLMKLLPDNEFDLAIVDPPYGGGGGEQAACGGRFDRYEPKNQKAEATPYRGHL